VTEIQVDCGFALDRDIHHAGLRSRSLGDKRMPEITRADVLVKQGGDRLPAAEWAAAQGDRAGFDLFVLIDDACDSSLGSQLDDLRSFITAQPSLRD
jgi:hypothetical protein